MYADRNNCGAFALFPLIIPNTVSLKETMYWTKNLCFNFVYNFCSNPFSLR
jgi:hypothetical protein